MLILGVLQSVQRKDCDDPCTQNNSLRAGFEPARGDPNGFQVQRLNHSAIAADAIICFSQKSIVNMIV